MASKTKWEEDKQARFDLAQIAKVNDNSNCVDCGASAPQWASPKFGIWVCLECAGKHRGLGVHISFIRSISMDGLKPSELKRMQLGGNKRWRQFWENHQETKDLGLTWDSSSIRDRYEGPVGEEYKERLTAEVEGKEYVPPAPGSRAPPQQFSAPARAATTSSMGGSRSGSPAQLSGGPALSGGKAKVDDAYFSRLGNANAARPADLPPSQGGKYSGFGSEMPSPPSRSQTAGPPGVDDFQKDPVAALTKGFGWFGGMVGKVSKQVNEGYIAPAAQRLAEADLSTTARLTAAQLAKSAQSAAAVAAQTAQSGSKDFRQTFNRFVEGEDSRKPLDESKTDFWESFGKPADERGLGSRAMGTGGGGNGGMGGSGSSMTGMAGGMTVGESNRRDEGAVIGVTVPPAPSSSRSVVKEKKPVEPAKVEEGDWEKW